jgi:heme ABC exporter ATP-binding subunit CcmA
MIEVRQLRKAFGLRPVLRGVDLDVAPGECLALMGPNGAGKTTLMRILSTLSTPTTGQVRVAGLPLPAAAGDVRRRLGVVAHHTLLYSDLTAEENLQLYARLYALRHPALRISAVLEQVGLARRARDLVRTLSRGMQQRLAIARALLPEPTVMLLDEPYTGLDPQAAAMLDALLQSMAASGRTVLLTTHDLPRALAVANRVAILSNGLIVHTAPTSALDAAAFANTYASFTN